MSALYTLTNGLSTDWMDLRPYASGFQFQGAITGTLTVVIETSNDPSTTKAGTATADTFTSTFDKVTGGPNPKFARLRATSGSGSCIASFGMGFITGGYPQEINPQSAAN